MAGTIHLLTAVSLMLTLSSASAESTGEYTLSFRKRFKCFFNSSLVKLPGLTNNMTILE